MNYDGIAKVIGATAILVGALGGVGLRCDYVGETGSRLLGGVIPRTAEHGECPEWLLGDDAEACRQHFASQ